jgi:hypothetical protein
MMRILWVSWVFLAVSSASFADSDDASVVVRCDWTAYDLGGSAVIKRSWETSLRYDGEAFFSGRGTPCDEAAACEPFSIQGNFYREGYLIPDHEGCTSIEQRNSYTGEVFVDSTDVQAGIPLRCDLGTVDDVPRVFLSQHAFKPTPFHGKLISQSTVSCEYLEQPWGGW